MANARVVYNYSYDIKTKEEFLSFVRVATLIKSTDCDFHIVGLDFVPADDFIPESSTPEYEVFKVKTTFKRISGENSDTETYRIYIEIGLYTSAEIEDDYGEPVYVMFLIYYKNLRGQYEFRTIKS